VLSKLSIDKHWDRIHEKQSELDKLLHDYWNQYSSFTDWQYWVFLGMFILPLIILYFTVDRKRIFELLFFGFVVHLLWAYTDIYLGRHNFMVHKYLLVPDMPFSVSVVASALPVSFILIYQYCTNHNKNYPLFMVIMSLLWSFGIATIERMLGMLSFHNGMNQIGLFIIDIAIGLVAWGMTVFFKKLHRQTISA
jgi:hypothetical protein